MKKIKKKKKKARVEACSDKIRQFFYDRCLKTGDMALIEGFNGEWSYLANLFGSKMISLKDYEKKVDELLDKWDKKVP